MNEKQVREKAVKNNTQTFVSLAVFDEYEHETEWHGL